MIDAYGNYGFGLNVDLYFDVMKIFHLNKPINPVHGNRNPTISSNSWGFRASQGSSGTYYFRQGTSGTGGVAYSSQPAFMQYLGSTGDAGRFKGEMLTNNLTEAGAEMVASGVIFVVAAGNSNQQQVSSSHPNYNNYWSSSPSTPLTSAIHDEFGSFCYNTTNRRGFPQQLGKYTTGTTVVYPAINIGALDDNYQFDGKERKVDYSDMGNEIDVFTPGDGTLSAGWAYGVLVPRHDQRVGGITSHDGRFSGTSSACPTAAGMIATALQYNRNWGWQDVRTWLHSLTEQSASTFYQGPEPSTATDPQWSDLNSLQGAARRVLYNNISANVSTFTATLVTGFVTLTKDYPVTPFAPVTATGGTTPYTWAVSPSLSSGLTFNTSTGFISGTPTVTLNTSSYTITVTDSASSSTSKSFSLEIISVQPLTLNVPISPLTYPAYFVLSPYQPVIPSGGISPYSYSISPAVPVGLAFNTSTGILSGQPVSLLSTTTYTVTVKDSNSPQSTATASFGLYIYALPLSVTVDIPSTSINPYIAIAPFIPVSASGGNGTKTLSISPALPAGLTFDSSTGAISGTANSIFSNTYAVTCTDSVGQTASGSFSLSSSAIALVLTTNVSTSTNIIFQPITPFAPITATGGSGSKSWSITPQLPTGVVFNTTNGTIVGTPTVQSPLISYTVTVTDQTGQTVSRSFGFRVSVPALVTTVEVAKILFYPGTTITPFTPISVSGGGGTKVLSISPPLPQGLSFNTSTGVVSGTPTVNGRSNVYVVTATDQAGQTSSKSFKLKIKSRLDVIDADDQNIVYDKLFSLMGTTVTGYGANTASKPVNYGQIVRDEDWDYMYDDIVRVKIHQYGTATNNLLVADPNQIVLDGVQDRIYTWAQLHLATSSTVHPSQLSSMSINTNEASPPEWISDNDDPSEWTDITGNGYIAAAGFTWFRPAQLNYFFNLGGSITPKITLGAGTIRDLLAWDTLVEEANQIVFSKDEFYTALNSPSKSFIHIITGPGNFDPNNKKKNVKYKKTKTYAANGIIIKFQIVDSRILASIQFVAGNGKKKKKGKGKNKKANYIVVRLQINTDFITEYSNANTGGIAAPIPQTQLINNCLSIDTRPVDPFTFAIGNESETRSIELRNNSTQTCNITDIFLTSYTQGIVSPTTLTIPPHSSSYINLKYTGNTAGLYKGYVNIESNINNFTIFTQVEVGAISPSSLILTTGTTDIIYQEFTVDLVAGPYERFDAVLAPSGNGFTFVEHPTTFASEIVDRFNVTFDPTSRPNGLYATTATVTVYPLDNNNEVAVFEVPIEIDLNVKRYNIGRWISALGHQTSALGLSFDYIEGKRYVTVGIGKNSPLLSELGSVNTFTSWSEVYRMIIEDRFETLYSSDHTIKQETNYASNFGVGKAAGSIITVKNEKYGNIEIFLNSLRYPGDDDTTTKILKGLSQAFYYYDPTAYRVTQLETVNQLTNEGCTRYFKSFDKDGTVETTLVVPNRNS
jgi:hypothetical protein